MFFKKYLYNKDIKESLIKKFKKIKIPIFFKDLFNLLLPISIVFGIIFSICFFI